MKKQILNLGKALNKAEQKQINGGDGTAWPDKYSCKTHCRGVYGIEEAICIPCDNTGPIFWVCTTQTNPICYNW